MKHAIVWRLVFVLGFLAGSGAQSAEDQHSLAHRRSRFAVIDPLYSTEEVIPDSGFRRDGAPWIYGESELECWRHQLLRQRAFRDCLHIGYPGEYHTPSAKASFRRSWPATHRQNNRFSIRATGDIVVSVNGRPLLREAHRDDPHQLVWPADLLNELIELRVDVVAKDDLPGILVADGPFATDAGWEWSGDGQSWRSVSCYPQSRSGLPPHRVEDPEVELEPTGRDGELYDFGRELFGRVAFRCNTKPSIVVGESPAEARSTDGKAAEQVLNLTQEKDGRWISTAPLAFRYLRIDGGTPTDVVCLASFHPVRYRGAFACSDERLTRVWMASAYTLRLCMHDLILDGIKRDRLPWIGDLAMSMMVDAYTFGDPEIIRRSLTALGRAGIERQDINGIVDYSLWWVIAHDHFQRYFGDTAYLRREWPRIKDLMQHLARRCDRDGLLVATPQQWVFIDWVNFDKTVALQVLWEWAQRSGADLAMRAGDPEAAAMWHNRAAALAKTLHARGWNAQAGGWIENWQKPPVPSRHANLLAAISGLATPDQHRAIRQVLTGTTATPVGTPYMAGFENLALSRLGATDEMLARVGAYWGGMLDRGATTFWEAYDPAQRGADAYAFYGRPFGKSLCHAWSAGPAMLLPSEVLGIHPREDGWKRFGVDPHLGSLAWACACVPTPQGDIHVEADRKQVIIRVPAGTTLEFRQRHYPGPATVTEPIATQADPEKGSEPR